MVKKGQQRHCVVGLCLNDLSIILSYAFNYILVVLIKCLQNHEFMFEEIIEQCFSSNNTDEKIFFIDNRYKVFVGCF